MDWLQIAFVAGIALVCFMAGAMLGYALGLCSLRGSSLDVQLNSSLCHAMDRLQKGEGFAFEATFFRMPGDEDDDDSDDPETENSPYDFAVRSPGPN